MSFAAFWKRNLAYLKLGARTKLEYRLNFCIDVLVGPICAFLIEAAFWIGCFQISGMTRIGNFTESQYLTYLLWLMLQLGGANWRFERVMIQDINSGAVNALLVRPGSFYEFQLGQFFSFKLTTLLVSIPLILSIAAWWGLPLSMERFLPALSMGICYLLFIHTLNVALASMAFFFDHVYSLNTTKNMILWFLTGELFPLDLLPLALSKWLILLPFSCGVYLPAAYISGRIDTSVFLSGFVSLAIGIAFLGVLTRWLWRKGLSSYGGTGA